MGIMKLFNLCLQFKQLNTNIEKQIFRTLDLPPVMIKRKLIHLEQEDDDEDRPFNTSRFNNASHQSKHHNAPKYKSKKKKKAPSFCCYQYYKLIVCIFLGVVLLPLAFSAFSSQLNNLEENDDFQMQQHHLIKNVKTETGSYVSTNRQQTLKIEKNINKRQEVRKNQQVKKNNVPVQSQTMQNTATTRAGITSDQVAQSKQFLKLKNLPKNDSLAEKQYRYYEQKYQISTYEELPICIVVPTYNNAKDNRHFQNMNSILQQNYTNYHIVFIDDASNDTTAIDMKKYFQQKNISEPKLQFIVNQQRKMAMPNLRMAAKQYCKPEEIFIIVDGDDQLLGRQVFKHFNSVFQKQMVWVMYSNFLASRGSVGYSRPFSQATIQRNAYRRAGFVISHLRAFYTKIFLLINEEDLKDANGSYFKAANDVAICIPILQMAHQKVTYSPQLSYYYNSNTGLNNHRVRLKEQKDNERYIRKKKSYTPLTDLFQKKQGINSNPTNLKLNQQSGQNQQKQAPKIIST